MFIFNFLISIFIGRGLIKGFPRLLVMGPGTYLSELRLLIPQRVAVVPNLEWAKQAEREVTVCE